MASNVTDLLLFEPEKEIFFYGNGSVASLKLTNTDKDIVLFKVKSTSPNQIKIEPNNGIITPFGNLTIDIKFIFTPCDNSQQALFDVYKVHKLLVVFNTVSPVLSPQIILINTEEILKEKTKGNLYKKIKCVFRSNNLKSQGSFCGNYFYLFFNNKGN